MSDSLSALFATPNGKPADELDALFDLPANEPLPAGSYAVELISGKVGASKSGKPRYELRARISDGDHAGRVLFDDLYLSASSWWKTGPLLKKIGIDSAEKLRRELPAGLLATATVKLEAYEGTARNKISDIVLTGRKAEPSPAPADPFAPSDNETSEGTGATDRGDAWEHPADRKLTADQLTFSFGANATGPYQGPGGGQ